MNIRFEIKLENRNISDEDLYDLLEKTYINEGYTDREVAKTIFAPENVKIRGQLISVEESQSNSLAGMIILVPFSSPARKFANEHEAEIHLLCVRDQYRGFGLGRQLINQAIELAKDNSISKILLWTQPQMKAAQKLYKHAGFQRIQRRDFTSNSRDFLFYELCL